MHPRVGNPPDNGTNHLLLAKVTDRKLGFSRLFMLVQPLQVEARDTVQRTLISSAFSALPRERSGVMTEGGSRRESKP